MKIARTLLWLTLFALFACTTWKVPAYGTLTAMSTALEGAAEQLPMACQKAAMAEVEKATTEEEAKKNAGAVLERCQTAASAIVATYGSLKLARDGIKDAPSDAAAAKSLVTWAKLAYDAYQNLMPILRALGIDLKAVQ